MSCTLQENGHFKLYTETDVTLVSFVQLSQLSRCAVQQLDPSVLEDEFCISLYPQYTAHSGSDSPTRPIYLSLESRGVFEVWFVLLRAFTIPELYGPEQMIANDELTRGQHIAAAPYGTSTADMFRIERFLSLRITEAKLSEGNKDTPRSKKQAKVPAAAHSTPISGDYYSEVLLDGEIRAKTASRHDTATPFWR